MKARAGKVAAEERPRYIFSNLPTTNTHFSRILGGAAAFLQSRPGWFLDNAGSAKFREREDGRIVACFRREDCADGPPTVNVANSLAETGLPTVVSDDFAVGEMAAEYYLAQRRTAFAVFCPCTTHYGRLRVAGFEQALARSGFTAAVLGDPELFANMRVAEVDVNIRRMRELLAELPRPCALFAVDDLRAALLCRIALAAGYRIPEDFVVLGVDDNRVVCDSAPVALSSVALDSRGIGYRAAEVLVGMIEEPGKRADAALRIELPPLKVVERASTAGGMQGDPLVTRAQFVIEREFNQQLRVEELAQRVGVTPRYLQMRFKAATGGTPQQALLERRLKEAKALLRGTSLSITEVAYASGFSDYKQMALHLRRNCGLSAREYRAAKD